MIISELFSNIISDTTVFYYILSILITSIAVIAAYLYTNKKLIKDPTECIKIEESDDDSVMCNGKNEDEIFEKYFKNEKFFDLNDNSSPDDRASVIMGKIKAAKYKAIEKTLSEQQKEAERQIERQQLAQIFDLLKRQEQEHNLGQMQEEDFQAQLGLYR